MCQDREDFRHKFNPLCPRVEIGFRRLRIKTTYVATKSIILNATYKLQPGRQSKGKEKYVYMHAMRVYVELKTHFLLELFKIHMSVCAYEISVGLRIP
jgi:hypothetical protein